MNTRRLLMSSLLIAAVAVALGLPSAAQAAPSRTPEQLVRDALALYTQHTEPAQALKVMLPEELRDYQRRTRLAEAARERWGQMSKAAIEAELAPLRDRVRPYSPLHAGLAFTLAFYGIDIPENVEILRMPETPRSEASETDYWTPSIPETGIFPVSGAYVPTRLVRLYTRTRRPEVLDALFQMKGMDGEGAAQWHSAMLDVSAKFPEEVVAFAARTDATSDTLASALGWYDFLEKDRARVRTSLKSLAASQNPEVARTAKRVLARMNDTARKQVKAGSR